MNNSLNYPIGKYEWNDRPDDEDIKKAINLLETFPSILKETISTLSPETLMNKYRPKGWSIAQVVHHLCDSHMHCYLRMKHALLEDVPSIKDYNQADWAELPDASQTDLNVSLQLLSALHKRWTLFLNSLSKEDLTKSYFHPERAKQYPIGTAIMIYAWHSEHHLAHIQNAIQRGY
ncbi:MAG: putative metal-dependent hydrolase [Flavobacteriaceae bacterium]